MSRTRDLVSGNHKSDTLTTTLPSHLVVVTEQQLLQGITMLPSMEVLGPLYSILLSYKRD